MEAEIHPSAKAQDRYPLDEYPCERCANPDEGLPHLIDHGSEFYWHHQHKHPGGSWRSGCPRFGVNKFCGSHPRAGTAASRFKRQRGTNNHIPRTDAEYEAAVKAVEERGADDALIRDGVQF